MIKKAFFSKLPFVALALVMLVLPLVAACQAGGDVGNTGKSLKVGIMVPETGVAASKGRPMAAGVRDAIKYINEELGGVMGYQIEALVRDNSYDASKTTTIIEELSPKEFFFLPPSHRRR